MFVAWYLLTKVMGDTELSLHYVTALPTHAAIGQYEYV